jgi:uncharacterized membrane protein YkvA (DUF1232 family)
MRDCREKTMQTPKNFSRYLFLAQRFLKVGRLPALLLSVARKREKLGTGFAELADELKLLQQLCVAWWRGEYRALSTQALLAVVAALLYFVTPLDAIPDWLLGVGFVDDLAVLAWVLGTWRAELAAFKAWRDAQSPEVLKTLERLPAIEAQPEPVPKELQ